MNYKLILNRYLPFIMILSLGILSSSCNPRIFSPIYNHWIERHTIKHIKLFGIKDSLSVCYENDSAKIIIGLFETLHTLEKVIEKGHLDTRFDREQIADLNKAINFLSNSKTNVIINDCLNMGKPINLNLCKIWGTIDCYALRKILLRGNAQIYNKRLSRYEKRILIIHDKIITAGELHEYYSFQFVNKSEFYNQLIAI